MRLLKFLYILVLVFSLSFVAQANEPIKNYHLPAVLSQARHLLTRDPVRRLLLEAFRDELKIPSEVVSNVDLPHQLKEIPESHFVSLLLQNPKLWREINLYLREVPEIHEGEPKQDVLRANWRARFLTLFEKHDIKSQLRKMLSNPLEATVLTGPEGSPGWTKREFYVNHEITRGARTIPASNLKKKLIDFIEDAKKEIVINVFDFDLMDVAEALAKKARKGISVQVGIDSGVIKDRPEVKRVFDFLKSQRGVIVHAVDSVGLNHQKLVAIDWSLPKKAKVILLSGNFTQSCLGPEGDAVVGGAKLKNSIPNANHMLIYESYVMANLIRHELSKTLDSEFQLRGREYPRSGSWKIFGPPSDDSGEEDPYVILAFTPGAGLEDPNNEIIANLISQANGRIRMVQFAASSKIIEDALFKKMLEQQSLGKDFKFASVGDTPFSMREWSLFLKMSGYTIQEENKVKRWVEVSDSRWLKALGPKDFEELQENILVAPPIYGHHNAKLADGTSIELTSKIHHKILIVEIDDKWVTLTGSYNFSGAAPKNQEYIAILVNDKEMSENFVAIHKALAKDSEGSVKKIAEKRNRRIDDRDPKRKVIRDSESDRIVKQLDP